ncbi:MAG: hypothetical protein SFY69_04450 [Planctomycetota bacterium]|nr:hypothetical protein [Planctomycetota bacterium]
MTTTSADARRPRTTARVEWLRRAVALLLIVPLLILGTFGGYSILAHSHHGHDGH